MYVPQAFRVEDKKTLLEFIRANSFGILISKKSGRMAATHIPFLIEEKTDGRVFLTGHMAKANIQWQGVDSDGSDVLVVFSGPHAYISPSWYDDPNSVPTWNYVAVHVEGNLQLVDDIRLGDILEKMIRTFEDGHGEWKYDREGDFFRKLSQAVVGFEIEIVKLEGKWKLSQNHSKERREKVVAALKKKSDSHSKAIAEMMKSNLSI